MARWFIMRVSIVLTGLLSLTLIALSLGGGAAVVPLDDAAGQDVAPTAPTGTTDAAPMRDAAGSVDVFDFDYSDAGTGTPVTSVATGETITWFWSQGVHTVTHRVNPALDVLPPEFDSGFISANEPDPTFSLAFDEPGVYEYYCTLHVTMRGVVVVA